jgi:hypothetical protein
VRSAASQMSRLDKCHARPDAATQTCLAQRGLVSQRCVMNGMRRRWICKGQLRCMHAGFMLRGCAGRVFDATRGAVAHIAGHAVTVMTVTCTGSPCKAASTAAKFQHGTVAQQNADSAVGVEAASGGWEDDPVRSRGSGLAASVVHYCCYATVGDTRANVWSPNTLRLGALVCGRRSEGLAVAGGKTAAVCPGWHRSRGGRVKVGSNGGRRKQEICEQVPR